MGGRTVEVTIWTKVDVTVPGAVTVVFHRYSGRCMEGMQRDEDVCGRWS